MLDPSAMIGQPLLFDMEPGHHLFVGQILVLFKDRERNWSIGWKRFGIRPQQAAMSFAIILNSKFVIQ